jgi:cobalt/nickel transport system ATP-binding protein
MSHHIVEAKDIHYSYTDGTVALDGVSFRISHGESVAIVGENGAGKSTLLLHTNGCVLPQKGTMRIGDCLVLKETLQTVRRSVGMVFQNADDQLFMPTVFDDAAFALRNMGMPENETEEKVMQALATVGIVHLRARTPYKLSQGEKRAATIAVVLAMSPDILVMDEPTASLDPRSRQRLIQLLKTFKHTKILATHDLAMAQDVCERTIVIHQGRVIADGPTKDIFADRAILESASLV